MTGLRSWEWGDPQEVAIRREEATCKGCRHERKEVAWGQSIWICEKRDRAGNRRQHGRKCIDYGEKMSAIKEQVAGAVESSNLAWSDYSVRDIDRLTALGMCDALGAALWRFKYANDATSHKQALYLLVRRASKQIKNSAHSYLASLAAGAIREWTLDACTTCHGAGQVIEKSGVVMQCHKCGGGGLKRYSDGERARNSQMPPESWSKHAKNYDIVMGCLTGASASVSVGLKKLLAREML